MRLLSYNIHKGIGGRDRRYRLERVIQVIEDQNPDLICLQEVDRHVARTRHDDQPRQFIEAFHAAAHLYQLNVKLKNGGYGNLLLSRWPFRDHHQISLRLKHRKARGAQMAVIDSPEGSFHLVHWHLGLAERERHWQVLHLMEHHLFRQSAHLPTLVVGDFNDWRNTLAKGPFAIHGFDQLTAPRSRFLSFPAYWPVTSLDKAFARGALAIRHIRIAHSRLARDASDHLPLVIDFHLEHPRPLAAMTASTAGRAYSIARLPVREHAPRCAHSLNAPTPLARTVTPRMPRSFRWQPRAWARPSDSRRSRPPRTRSSPRLQTWSSSVPTSCTSHLIG